MEYLEMVNSAHKNISNMMNSWISVNDLTELIEN